MDSWFSSGYRVFPRHIHLFTGLGYMRCTLFTVIVVAITFEVVQIIHFTGQGITTGLRGTTVCTVVKSYFT